MKKFARLDCLDGMSKFKDTSKLLCLEKKHWAEGFLFIAGVDEVGRGPLAGPVVAAAVVLPRDVELPPVFDSKQLTAAQREELAVALRNLDGIDYGIAEVGVEIIDSINILQATHLAMRLAVEKLKNVDYILVDGRPVRGFSCPSEAVVKGDAKSASIAAASILAKVYRDALMDEYARVYPEYGFEHHKGYGTAEHLAALAAHGVTPIHRRTFAPVRDILNPPPEQMELF